MGSESNREENAGVPRQRGFEVTSSPTHAFFGLSYASYLTIPRLALQELPFEWQEKFFALLTEAFDEHGLSTPDYVVLRRDSRGRLSTKDPWANYRHGTVEEARDLDLINQKTR